MKKTLSKKSCDTVPLIEAKQLKQILSTLAALTSGSHCYSADFSRSDFQPPPSGHVHALYKQRHHPHLVSYLSTQVNEKISFYLIFCL